jgi:hypothetical protein
VLSFGSYGVEWSLQDISAIIESCHKVCVMEELVGEPIWVGV